MKAALALAAALATSTAAAPPAPSEIPWLENFVEVASTRAGDRTSSLPLDIVLDSDPSCEGQADGALVLRANVSDAAGVETLIGSYAHGIVVSGVEGQPIATAPGYRCGGSADDIHAMAVGLAWGTPMIALVLTSGGQRESLTWVAFYRMGRSGTLEATFSGAVEQYEDGAVRRGHITLLPGALIHRNPTGETVLWVYHPVAGVYVPYSLGTVPHARR